MAKRQSKIKQIKALQKSVKLSPQERLDRFVEKAQYIAAIDLLKKTAQSHPQLQLTPCEGELWLRQGQAELARSQPKAADPHFAKALELAAPQDDWLGDAYYFAAKSLLLQDRSAEALTLIQSAFDQEKLPKTHGGCYLKLLLIQGETERVKALVEKESKRFYAAQLHWVRGIFALQAGQEDDAIAHFRKVKDPITPGDNPKGWPVYARQRQGDWSGASSLLSQFLNNLSYQRSSSPKGPLSGQANAFVEWLDLHQRVNTGRLMRSPFERRTGFGKTSAVEILELVNLLEQGNVHDAGHAFLNLDHSTQSSLLELVAIRRPLMMAAGDQSIKSGEFDCAAEFWEAIAADLPIDSPLNFQLQVNLIRAYRAGDADPDALKPIRRLVTWLEQGAKAADGSLAQGWSEARRKSALIHLHCFAADAQMISGGRTPALRAIKEAEKLDPQHAEVLARRGLATVLDRKFEEAIALLTTAMEKGCTFPEAYSGLLRALDHTQDKAAKADARRRFGKRFGDVVEAGLEEELPGWIEAIATQSYVIFESLIHPEDPEGPEEVACGHFLDAVESEPSQSGRVDVDLDQAAQLWKHLVAECSPQEQVTVLEAIVLCLQLFCKRIKGRDALIEQYQQQLLALEAQVPAALPTYLALASLKNTAKANQQLRPHLERLLKASPSPGDALAQVQFQARWFGNGDALLPFIEAALKKEPQNPQLLLAKATTYPLDSKFYDQYKDQGFDIARRLQDAPALQAFRKEEQFVTQWQTAQVMPKNLNNFNPNNPVELDRMLEQMIRNMLGPKMSKQELEMMMPILKQQFMNDMLEDLDLDDDGDDFDDGGLPLPFIFGPPSGGGSRRGGGRSKSSKSKSKRR